MTSKQRRWLIVAGAAACLILALTTPLMVRAWKQGGRFEQAFQDFSSAIQSQDFQLAYENADPAFKAATTYPEFLGIHRDLTRRLGSLKTISHTRTIVDGKGDPMQWVASTDATLQFAQGSARFRYSFRESAGKWRLLGLRPLE